MYQITKVEIEAIIPGTAPWFDIKLYQIKEEDEQKGAKLTLVFEGKRRVQLLRKSLSSLRPLDPSIDAYLVSILSNDRNDFSIIQKWPCIGPSDIQTNGTAIVKHYAEVFLEKEKITTLVPAKYITEIYSLNEE